MYSKYSVEAISNTLFPTNTYIVYDNVAKEGLIVDPSFDIEAIERKVIALGIKIIGILVTHGHQDHIFGVPYFKERYNCEIWASQETAELFADRIENLSFIGSSHFGLEETIFETEVYIVEDDKTYTIRGFQFSTGIYPGHSRGCTVFEFDVFMLSGDFVFEGTIGRVDWPGSNANQMKESLRWFKDRYTNVEKVIYAGHNHPTSIQKELQFNPFLLNIDTVDML